MKRFFILLSVLALSVGAFATGQEGDVIYINGEKWQLLGKPIESDSILSCGVNSILPENHSRITSNWSGYTAYWSIKGNQLFLDSILVECYIKESRIYNTRRIPAEDMRRVFKTYYKKKSILATWVDYNIRAAKGPTVYYEHMGYARNNEYEQIFTLNKGKITDCKSYHNKVAVNGFSFSDLKNAEEMKAKFPLHIENYPELAGAKRIFFSVKEVQLNTLGQLVDCKVEANIYPMDDDKTQKKEIKERLAQEMKDNLMKIFPWKTLYINGEYVSDNKNHGYMIPYNLRE